MADELKNLLGIGKLKEEAPEPSEVTTLLKNGKSRLRDAQNATLALGSRFDLAYGAAHALSLYALRRQGYRPVNQRLVVFQVLPHTVGVGPEVWRLLVKAHTTRNAAEYDGVMDVDERFVMDLVTAVKTLAAKL